MSDNKINLNEWRERALGFEQALNSVVPVSYTHLAVESKVAARVSNVTSFFKINPY